jgi:hypothetical protein
MKTACLLTVALLSCTAAAAAQSTTQPTPQVSAPAAQVHDSRNQVPVISPNTMVKLATIPAQNDSVCYALRTYQFTPTEPASGAASYKGQSTCVPARSANAMIVSKPR